MRCSMLALGWLLVAGCVGDRDVEPLGDDTEASEPLDWSEDPELTGFRFRLSEATAMGGSYEPLGASEARVLSDADTRALLARVPAIEVQGDEAQPFAFREGSQPPPRTGAEVQLPFPPPAAPDAPDPAASGPLRVLRFAPEGDVPMAPHLSVTFSQPMVPVTTQDAAAEVHPVQITPQPEGQWRWIGTRTVLFEPTAYDRFPMATTYTVTVPPGTASEVGGTLAEAASFTFTTPPLQVRRVYPLDGPHDRDPVMFIGFDQRVDAAALLDHVTLTAGNRSFPLRAATEAEVERDDTVRAFVEASEVGRFITVKATERLPAATRFQLAVNKGAPSAEGPNPTPSAQSHTFWTYDPLEVDDQSCWEGKGGCVPEGWWYIEFNNPLDAAAFDPASVRVDPQPDRLRVAPSGQYLQITASSKAHTKYQVTLPATLRDAFGQTLGEEQTVTFRTGAMNPTFQGPGREFLVLDPAVDPTFPIWTVNHQRMRVRVFRASPEAYAQVSEWMRTWRYDGRLKGEPPVDKLLDEVRPIDDYVEDERIETGLDLSPWLDEQGHGHLLVWAEPDPQPRRQWDQIHVLAWVQSTDIALTAYTDHSEMLAWANDLGTGAPLEGVEVQLVGSAASASDPKATTAGSGLATVALRDDSSGPHVLVARNGSDVAMLPSQWGWWNEYGSWYKNPPQDTLRWYTFDDRHMYRPAETVSMKGWVRQFDNGRDGDLSLPASMPSDLEWVVRDAHGVELSRGTAQVGGLGGFHFTFELPATPNLGWASVELVARGVSLGGSSHYHSFQIQEFRRPEFEVATRADPGPYFLGESAVVTVSAEYYAGGALPGAEVSWTASASAASYSPPGWQGFRFGTWTPWWSFWRDPWAPDAAYEVQSLSGKTDATGQHHVQVDFLAVNPPRPYSVNAEATVFDVNRQRWSSSAGVLVHPSEWYVGVRTSRGFYEKGAPIDVDLMVVDIDGHVLDGRRVQTTLALMEWENQGGVWQEVEREPVTCAETSGAEPVRCTFHPAAGGSYALRASVRDSAGRPNETQMRVWVSGGKGRPSRGVEREPLTLVPDKEEYAPGDTAEVLVQAPFWPAEGLWTLQRQGLVHSERFTIDGPSITLDVPITEAYLPTVDLDVEIVGAAKRLDDQGQPLADAPARVAHAWGTLSLPVPPHSRELAVQVVPRQTGLSPGGSTVLDVVVRDAQGNPVEAELAVVAVDEAVLALSGYRVPDPLAVFYAQTWGGVTETFLRDHVQLANPDQAVATATATGMLQELGYAEGEAAGNTRSRGGGGDDGRGVRRDAALLMASPAAPPPPDEPMSKMAADFFEAKEDESAQQPQISVRKDFAATALFAPRVRSGRDGKAQVELDLPDSLTRYRVMAVAVSGAERFGTGESTVTARLPVMLRPSPPRFMNFGDRVELPLMIQNQTDTARTVDVAIRAVNATVIKDVSTPPSGPPVRIAGRRASVPANDRIEVRIPIAADMAGTARFQAVIASGDFADATTFELPVWTPATAEAFATYGVIDEGMAVQPVEAPVDVWPQFGALEVTTSSTTLQALTDAMIYLVQYPYECNEQLASRVLAVAALRDVLTAFESDQLPPPEDLEAAVARDLERLRTRQQSNGGFSFWRYDSPDWPYPTVHVAHALARAEAKGYPLPDGMKTGLLGYLRDIERHIPHWYSQEARWTIIAYALYVRHQWDDSDPVRARGLLREAGVERLPLEAQGWILPTLHDAGNSSQVSTIVGHLGNNVAETAAGAHFVTSYSDGAYVLLHSDRRVDGVLLESLIHVAPDSDLIPKLVQGLLAHRKAGRWGNTQENAFVLVAMDRYFGAYESQTPDFVARVWLGERYAGDHAFKGRSTDYVHMDIPMGYLTDPGGKQDLIVQKDGDEGRLYYRVGLRYAPKSLELEPADRGFVVEREYAAIDDPDDVTKAADGTWHIRAGARVRVRLTMVAPARRYHVALIDPLPAGLEAQNPALAVTGSIPADPEANRSGYWWWRGTWYEHQNLRDERVEAYTSLLWDGVYSYSYVASATTPGEYVVPPARAEEMYTPETFGRTGTDRVIVR